MANISDYLDWRGDITMEIDPFNEVDNLVLAELAYTDFGGIVPGLNKRDNGSRSGRHTIASFLCIQKKRSWRRTLPPRSHLF